MNAIQIINKVIGFYTEKHNPRAKKDHDDFYYVTYINGKKTHDPVGQCMYKKYRTVSHNWEWRSIEEIRDSNNGSLDNILLKSYHGQPIIFWKDLQFIHDTDDFWDLTKNVPTLSKSGKDRVKFLKKFYTLGRKKEESNIVIV